MKTRPDPEPSHQDVVEPLLSEISVENQRADLLELTAFHNRYYETQDGVDAAKWIVDRVAAVRLALPLATAHALHVLIASLD